MKRKNYFIAKCDKYFTLKASLTRHNNEVHEEKTFHCKKCDKFYASDRSLKAHDNAVHAKKESIKQEQKNDEKSQKCPKCDLSFFREYLQRHIDTAHEGKKPYKCNICDSDFKTTDELEKHKKKVHEGKKLFHCSICSTGFGSKNILKTHLKTIHEDPRKYKSNVCDSSDYKTKDELEKHNRIFHQGSFQCYICSDSFVTFVSLKNHLKHIHEALLPQINYTYQVKKKNVNANIEKKKIACKDCGETLNIGESRECETKWKLFLSQCLP